VQHFLHRQTEPHKQRRERAAPLLCADRQLRFNSHTQCACLSDWRIGATSVCLSVHLSAARNGIRLNTREVRAKEQLQNRRLTLIEELIKTDPTYRPPTDYRCGALDGQNSLHSPTAPCRQHTIEASHRNGGPRDQGWNCIEDQDRLLG
jgi:Splicing factor 1 helix-hairpin domain